MSRKLTRDELDYIVCALQFQIEHDDNSNPPPLAAGESALDKLARYAASDRQTVVFDWNTEQGECIECGLPAAYRAPYMYGDTPHVGPESLLCCVCAAQHAASGEQIVYLYAEAMTGGSGMITYEDAVDAAASLHDRGINIIEPQEHFAGDTSMYREYVRGQAETLARLFPVAGQTTEDRVETILRDIQAMVTEGSSTR